MASAASLRLELAGVDTFAGSELCGRCPLGALGCCAAPPAFTWSDIGRIVGHGGSEWLRAEIAAGRLRPIARGLAVERWSPAAGEPLRCAYHGASGCRIDPRRRSATCNDYLCADALADGARLDADTATAAANAHQALASLYARWDEELEAMVRARWSPGPAWDERFLETIGGAYGRLCLSCSGELDLVRGRSR